MFQRHLIIAAASVLLAATTAWAQVDTITLRNGNPPRGEVTEMSPNDVTVVANTIPTKVPANEVVRITYNDDPADFRFARSSIGTGNFEDAIDKLERIDLNSVSRSIIAHDIEYYRAYCRAKLALGGTGDKKVAAGMFSAFLSKYPTSYHYYEANEIMGDLATSLGLHEPAARFYGVVGNAPWPDFKLRAAVLTGQALLAQKNFADAMQRFDMVIGANMTGPFADRQKQFATLGKAVCLVESNKSQEGIQLVEKVIANGDAKDIELFAKAYNALGACYLKGGQTKDALMAYLHVDMLFYRDPEAHAEALYHLSKLWPTVNKADRALEARNLLKTRYAGTQWNQMPN